MKIKNLDDAFWEVLSWVYDDIKRQAFFYSGRQDFSLHRTGEIISP